jgi:hypothetical protein
MKTLLNPAHRAKIYERFQKLEPAQPALWGKMTNLRMLAHLTDQMRLTLGDQPLESKNRPPLNPIKKMLFLYVLPWPKGKIKGPPEAFISEPGERDSSEAKLKGLVERFANEEPTGPYPDHPIFGTMKREAWGVFCHKHFNHHLRPFGV